LLSDSMRLPGLPSDNNMFTSGGSLYAIYGAAGAGVQLTTVDQTTGATSNPISVWNSPDGGYLIMGAAVGGDCPTADATHVCLYGDIQTIDGTTYASSFELYRWTVDLSTGSVTQNDLGAASSTFKQMGTVTLHGGNVAFTELGVDTANTSLVVFRDAGSGALLQTVNADAAIGMPDGSVISASRQQDGSVTLSTGLTVYSPIANTIPAPPQLVNAPNGQLVASVGGELHLVDPASNTDHLLAKGVQVSSVG
jgi:hypothetical protein